MKFKAEYSLQSGHYICKISLTELTKEDETKAAKFGYPFLKILVGANLAKKSVPLNLLNNMPAAFFPDQAAAEAYGEELKQQIKILKKAWDNMQDTFSREEEI